MYHSRSILNDIVPGVCWFVIYYSIYSTSASPRVQVNSQGFLQNTAPVYTFEPPHNLRLHSGERRIDTKKKYTFEKCESIGGARLVFHNGH